LLIEFILIFAGYYKLIKLKTPLSKLFPILVLLLGLLFISYPAFSTDMFDYHNYNRIFFVHHQNPYLVPPATYPNDQNIYFGNWYKRTVIYPPLTFFFSAGVFLLIGDHVVLSLLGFKLLGLTFYLLVIYLLSKNTGNKNSNKHQLLLATIFNPLLLIEVVGHGHNDIIMGLFILLSAIFIINKKPVLSGILISLSFLAKVLGALAAPVILWEFLKKRQYRDTGKLILGLIIGFVPLFLVFNFFTPNFINALLGQSNIYFRSLPTLIHQLLLFLKIPQALLFEKLFSIMLWMLISVYGLKRFVFKPIDSLVFLLMGYLLIVAPMFQPWYVIWVLPLLPLVTSKKLQLSLIVFSLSALCQYPVAYLSLYFHPLHILWQLSLFLVVALPPFLILFGTGKMKVLSEINKT
jgi:alpha-1,6-mannosyltransferase